MALAVSFMNAAKWFIMQVVIVLGVLFPRYRIWISLCASNEMLTEELWVEF